MKVKVYTVLTILFAVAVLIAGLSKGATGQNLILASVDYVDARFNELNARIAGLQSGSIVPGSVSQVDPALSTRLTNVEQQLNTSQTRLDQMIQKMEFYDFLMRDLSEGTVYQVIRLAPGSRLLASGTSEFVLRSGTATAIGNAKNEGLSNVTLGTEVRNGQNIPRNHLLIIPRGDGRGILAVTECFVLFKGIWHMN